MKQQANIQCPMTHLVRKHIKLSSSHHRVDVTTLFDCVLQYMLSKSTTQKDSPPQRVCVQLSWSGPGRGAYLRGLSGLRPWTYPPCAPPWAFLRTDSSGGQAPCLGPHAPEIQSHTQREKPREREGINKKIKFVFLSFFSLCYRARQSTLNTMR